MIKIEFYIIFLYYIMNIGICGFNNFGNTCYFNSVIQLILRNPSFIIYMNKCDNNNNGFNVENTFTNELYKIYAECLNASYAINPRSLLNYFYSKYDYFKDGQQHDAHECLNFILDDLYEESVKNGAMKIKNKSPVIQEYENLMLSALNHDNKVNLLLKNNKIEFEQYFGYKYIEKLYLKKYNPFIQDITIFQIIKVSCCDCGHETVKYEHSPILQLDVKKTLDEAISDYTALKDTTDYKCDACLSINNKIQTKILRNPKSLYVQLKRFELDMINNIYKKNNSRVDYPLNLNLKKYCHESILNKQNDHFEYEYIGCINHHNSNMNAGHYTAEIHNMYDDKIYKFDDSNVYENITKKISDTDTYIILYSLSKLIKNE